MELELRHLNSLCVIADAGSVSKAAARLGVSQPGLSAQLGRVERELGGEVFLRGRSGVTVTPFGQFILTRARSVLLAVSEMRRDTYRRRCPEQQVVRLGGIGGAVSVGLADRLSDLLPEAEVRLQAEYSPRVLWDLLLADRLDAAALVDYPGFTLRTPPTVLAKVIAVEPVFIALPEAHRLADRAEVDLADLADEQWALTAHDGAGWPDCFYAVCESAGFTPRVPYTVSDGTPIRELVATRRAVSPVQAVQTGGDGVVVRPLAGAPVQIRHLLVCREDSVLADIFDHVAELATEAYWSFARKRPEYQAWLARPA
ncbi:MAG TPA: LysR family transcriptional regulator [Actinokineospora sp.]|jgi:DNA-binding transcriptional LysR family regulator|nr:LysR family transcriptional regulator [Actinokineospora sp.]